MQKTPFLILPLFLLFPLSSYALEKICDASEINFDGTTLEDTCSGGTILDSYIGVNSFTGGYLSMPVGYWGSSFNLHYQPLESSSTPIGYFGTKRTNEYNDNTIPKFGQVPVGFLGSSRTNYLPYQYFYTEPVGFFGLYGQTELNFPDVPTPPADDTDYSMYPLVKPITESPSSGGGGSSQTCDMPIRITDVSTTVNNNGFLDSLELSWIKKDTSKIKVVEIAPESKTFYPQGNTYTETGLKEGTYSYFIISYNDCSPGLYSDVIRFDYKEKKETTIPYLTLSKNTLSLTIPKTIIPDPTSKFSLRCISGEKEVVKDFLSNDKTFNLNLDLLKASFSCSVQFFDTNGVLQTSETFLYTPLKKNLTNKEVLETIYGVSDSGASLDTLYQDIVTIEPNVAPEMPATYGSIGLLFANIVLGVYAENKEIATNVFTSLEIYPNSVKVDEVVSYPDFIKMYSFLQQHKKELQQKFITKIDDFFHPDENFITKKLLETYFLTEDLDMLKTTNSARYDILKACFGLERCPDRSIYQAEKKSIDIRMQGLENIFSGNDTDISYNDFIEILFKVLGNKEFVQEKYSIEEYSKFVEVLRIAITYGIQEEKFTYFSLYRNILSQIADERLKPQVKYLTKHYLRNINKLYESTQKEKLLRILSDYLSN